MQMLFIWYAFAVCAGINGYGLAARESLCDYLKIWTCSWVSLRSSLTPSELAVGSADAQIMSD